ncbi:MAG: sigma-70 family RNA polymerase sigma factor [Firmicutes bacterium]|jgi:RNA polymerase sigma-B factor|nr:sigma-70 family RNA polymerase sigma factor [Bacillota bacterium]MBR3375017.1 sigma-70 family RNA polymerase sigma factor [Bacillota bacterium]
MKDIEERNKLVEDHLYMIDILIRKYLGKGVEYDDLYQAGALALVNAADRFDPEKGFEFRTFATPTILGEIKKYFRDKEWSLSVPRRQKELVVKLRDAEDAILKAKGRPATVEELAEATGYTEEQVIQAMESSKAYGAFSLESAADTDDEGSAIEKFVGFTEKGYERIEMAEIISRVLESLSDTNRYIFRQRFLENRPQAEIAKELGVSQMTISRAEKNIVKKFKEEL